MCELNKTNNWCSSLRALLQIMITWWILAQLHFTRFHVLQLILPCDYIMWQKNIYNFPKRGKDFVFKLCIERNLDWTYFLHTENADIE